MVGFTPKKIEIRLSNLMAFDATAEGDWGCLPEHYPAIVDLVLAGKVALEPFIEYRPLSTINEVFEDLHARGDLPARDSHSGGLGHVLQEPRPRFGFRLRRRPLRRAPHLRQGGRSRSKASTPSRSP